MEQPTISPVARDGEIVRESIITISEQAIEIVEKWRTDIRQQLEQVEIRSMTYLSDGLKVNGYIVSPKAQGKSPCLIVNRGGNRELGAWNEVAVASLARMASWGYVVAASQYRGCGGSEGQDEFGGADVNDVLALIPLLRDVPNADASRIGMQGWSRGGTMTYLALSRTDAIAAAVACAAGADMFQLVRLRPEMETEVLAQLVPNYARDREAALAARSPIRWVEKLNKSTPLLILHGGADWRVSPTDSLAMATRLYECRHPFRLVFFEGGDHGLSEHREEVDRLTRSWLDTYVRDRKPWPSVEPHGP
jgi:dipeptidyl aminopeptidase/acylaminoacyl peptidase